MDHYDVVIAGGSIAGLLAAREIAYIKNISVLVLEEDPEIGTQNMWWAREYGGD